MAELSTLVGSTPRNWRALTLVDGSILQPPHQEPMGGEAPSRIVDPSSSNGPINTATRNVKVSSGRHITKMKMEHGTNHSVQGSVLTIFKKDLMLAQCDATMCLQGKLRAHGACSWQPVEQSKPLKHCVLPPGFLPTQQHHVDFQLLCICLRAIRRACSRTHS